MAKMKAEQMGTGEPYSKKRTSRVQRDAQGRKLTPGSASRKKRTNKNESTFFYDLWDGWNGFKID